MKLIPEWGAKAPLSYDLWKKRNEAIMKEQSQQNIRKVVFITECEDPLTDPEFSKWIKDNRGDILFVTTCKEGFIALAHFEPVFAENVVVQGSSPQPASDSQPSPGLPVA